MRRTAELARQTPAAAVRGWLAARRSRLTRQAYAREIVAFGRWRAGAAVDPETAIEAAAVAQLDELAHWRDELAERYAPATVALKLSAVRSFFRFLAGAGLRADNPAAFVEGPTVAAELQERPYLEAPDVRRLLAAAAATGDPRNRRRNWCLVTLGASVGLRRAEIAGLTVGDLDVERRALTVCGKRGKVRVLGLTPRIVSELSALAGDRSADTLLFGVSVRRIDQILRELARRAELDPSQVAPHALRRSFGTLYLDRGGDLDTLRRQLGHSSPATTARYDRRRAAAVVVEYE